MASSDNLLGVETWAFRPTFADSSWLSDAFARDTETLTKALQKSLSGQSDDNVSSDMINPMYKPDISPAQTPTVSGGSENETAVSKRRNAAAMGVNGGGKISKRKPRASKRTTTTFINADPANFRQMVQQVTGIRIGVNGQVPVVPVLKPEPQRPLNRLQTGCLPTLDTSAYFLDHHPIDQHEQNPLVSVSSSSSPPPPPPPLMVQPPLSVSIPPTPTMLPDVVSAGFDFDSFCSFPTLESCWKVM